MSEDLLLGVFLALPVLLALALHRLSRRVRARRAGWPALAAGNLLLLALLLSLATLAGEVYFRFIFDEPDSFGLSKTTDRWLARHYVRNAAGLRDDLPTYESMIAPGKRRVTFLGDSFTAGQGVEDVRRRFANLLRAVNPDWEIHVAAANGRDTPGELDFLKIAAATGYEFDLLVLVFNLNDIAPLLPRWWELHDHIYERSPPRLVQASWLFNVLYHRAVATLHPDVSQYFDFISDGYAGAAWRSEREILGEMRDIVASRGGRFAVVTFPLFHAMAPDSSFRDVHRLLGEFWREIGVPHLDLLGVYEGLPARELVVSRWDAHPNETSHRLAAEAIQPFLEACLR